MTSDSYIPKHRKEDEPVVEEVPRKMCTFCQKRYANDAYSGNSLLCGVCYYDL